MLLFVPYISVSLFCEVRNEVLSLCGTALEASFLNLSLNFKVEICSLEVTLPNIAIQFLCL